MKTKIQIKSVWGNLLFELEKENNTIKDTLVEAVGRGVSLREANLQGANLRRANLREANLREANLRRANLWGANLNGTKNLNLYWHVHHEILVENLIEPLKNRISYIKRNKPEKEVKLRLKLLKKVKAKNLPITKDEWEKLHKKECPNCPWDGSTIFSSHKGWGGV